MAKKKSFSLFRDFLNETLSVEVQNRKKCKEYESALLSHGISYKKGDLPKMKDGKVIGTSVILTVEDKEKLYAKTKDETEK